MRVFAAPVVLAIVFLIPADGAAQEKSMVAAAHLALGATVVSVRPPLTDPDVTATPAVVLRLSEELAGRLRAMERRFRDDQRLQRAATVMGLGAAVFGALRGKDTLTFAGTPALRLGLDRQLMQIRDRSGFAVEPSIGYHAVAIRVSRTFY